MPDRSRCPSPWWLPGGHLQTIYSAYFAGSIARLHFQRQRIDTPDGDFIDIDMIAPASQQLPQALVLFHGLEGSSQSHYIQAMAQHFSALGWLVAVAHFRGCSGTPNRLARAYYSGDSADISFIINHLHQQHPQHHWHAVGVSLGGNALLKYLGEQAQTNQPTRLHAAAAISVPLDLVSCGKHLSYSWAGKYIYCPHFLKSMKTKTLAKSAQFPDDIDTVGIRRAKTLLDFDDVYTAPMHGYRDAIDYWTQASSKPLLKHIEVPTLVINALNDPFVPTASLPTAKDCSAHVQLHQPATGGHVGFTTGRFPGHFNWLSQRIDTFFKRSTFEPF